MSVYSNPVLSYSVSSYIMFHKQNYRHNVHVLLTIQSYVHTQFIVLPAARSTLMDNSPKKGLKSQTQPKPATINPYIHMYSGEGEEESVKA